MFDRNGVGHISTAELLNRLKAELPSKEYEQYAQIITGYGSTINYIDMVQKNRNKF
jgi:Ca2+-binding EF-hand superfamily protein